MVTERRFVYNGGSRDVIPGDVTHVTIHESVKVVPARLFQDHQNIIELICHDGVERIEEEAFCRCPRLKRAVMLGVRVAEDFAFNFCIFLKNVECLKLERIGKSAFADCFSLSELNLSSVKFVEDRGLYMCDLLNFQFSENLESIGEEAFAGCENNMERIVIPLKSGLITSDCVFKGCYGLKGIDFVEGEILHDTVNTLLHVDWRNDMKQEIGSINQILANTDSGDMINDIDGGKARAIREWIRRVLRKIVRYKAKHSSLVAIAAFFLQVALKFEGGIVLTNVLPFLELPSHKFEGEVGPEDEDEDEWYGGDDMCYDEEESDEDQEDEEGGDEQDSEKGDGDAVADDEVNDELPNSPFDGEDNIEARKRRKTGD